MSQRIQTGQVTLSAAAQPLSATQIECRTFLLKNPKGNTGILYFGDSTVSAATGYPLVAGEEFEFTYNVRNGEPTYDLLPQDVYVVGSVNGEKAAWVSAGR